MQSLFAPLQKQVEELAQILSLELPHEQNFVDLLLEAHGDLGVVSAETLGLCDLGGNVSSAAEEEMLKQAMELRSIAQTHVIARAPRKTTPPQAVENRERIAQPADPGLLGSIATAIATCRLARRSVSLRCWKSTITRNSSSCTGKPRRPNCWRCFTPCWRTGRTNAAASSACDDARFALIWEDCERSDAVALVRYLLSAVKQWQLDSGTRGIAFGLSAGLATLALPPKNYPAQQLLSAADAASAVPASAAATRSRVLSFRVFPSLLFPSFRRLCLGTHFVRGSAS